MTSAEEADGLKNVKNIFFVLFHRKKRIDLLQIFWKMQKKSQKSAQPAA
jgi:hypothetical protein